MDYNFEDIERKWQKRWVVQKTFKVGEDEGKPKYYVLDMFPYPSGAGLHVGHPLGYIASDIVARYKRNKGFNVLHPMGYDSFGLPAEQYAIQTGQHPSITTETNVKRYREQLDRMGFSFDWDRSFKTSDPEYYKWTQWIFLQLFNSWYNDKTNCAEDIQNLVAIFEREGNENLGALPEGQKKFSMKEWNAYREKDKSDILMHYRLAYLGEAFVNWCPALGTVLANDEVKDGLSERGGHLVERKRMKQWSMRISVYSERLLKGLDGLDWTESIKDAQRNWIGKSKGGEIRFKVDQAEDQFLTVFSTRPDTLYGVTFLAIAPEFEGVEKLIVESKKQEIGEYINRAKNRSERDRLADPEQVTGVFTGYYAFHPLSGKKLQIWIADYVLVGYGTGAVMGVPAHDARDHRFALKFGLEIIPVIQSPPEWDIQKEAYIEQKGICINSEIINGLEVPEAGGKIMEKLSEGQMGISKVQFRLRDAVFGRQRYWGEPIPVYYEMGIPKGLPEASLPLVLPEVDVFLPSENGDPPLSRAQDSWKYHGKFNYEWTTMPGWAGSSWYFLRYMDPGGKEVFARREKVDYWGEIDLYIGGSEHTTGHLLYFRFWTKFLFDRGWIPFDEPAKKLINQGMIQGCSCLVHRVEGSNKIVSAGLKSKYKTIKIHIDVNLVDQMQVDLAGLKSWRTDFAEAEYELEDGKLICEHAVEKMSKRWHNVVNPDDICNKYGADTLRLYEMFLGPLEQSKPWSTGGITGVHGFLKKFWRLFYSSGTFFITDEKARPEELKILHKTIRKISEDIERFSFNTSVSSFMICVNELWDVKCCKREILEPLLILLSPFAPHFSEELWEQLGHGDGISKVPFPLFESKFVIESEFNYPVSFNGKTRFYLMLPLDLDGTEVEKIVLGNELSEKYLGDKAVRKIIFVKGKIINVVV